jgi:hypothetical protein
MIEIIAFEVEHALSIHDVRHDTCAQSLIADREYLEMLKQAGEAWTGIYNGQVVGCGGAGVRSDGMLQGWLILSAAIDRCKVSFHKVILKQLQGFHGCEMFTLVLDTDKRAKRWIERIGFVLRERWENIIMPNGHTITGSYCLYYRGAR